MCHQNVSIKQIFVSKHVHNSARSIVDQQIIPSEAKEREGKIHLNLIEAEDEVTTKEGCGMKDDI